MTQNRTQMVRPTTRLDEATKLTRDARAIHRPTVGEHCVVVLSSYKPREHVKPGEAADPARSLVEAQKRAAREIRRVCVHAGIDRLMTLTFAEGKGIADRDAVVKAVGRFFSGLRSRYKDLVYVYVLELHPGGHGYHVHCGVNRFVPKHVIQEVWTHGFVDIRRLTTKKRGSVVQQRRICARYLSKYATKAEDEGRRMGAHRYERVQGIKVPTVEMESASFEELVVWLKGRIRRPITWIWCSLEEPKWLGPKVLCLWE